MMGQTSALVSRLLVLRGIISDPFQGGGDCTPGCRWLGGYLVALQGQGPELERDRDRVSESERPLSLHVTYSSYSPLLHPSPNLGFVFCEHLEILVL